MTTASYSVDIDVGGTFTDCFVARADAYRTAKSLTTPYDLTECVTAAVESGGAAFGEDIHAILRKTSVFRLSTTLGTNTVLQRRGSQVAMLVSRADTDHASYKDLEALIPSEFVMPLSGRMSRDGEEIEPLDREEILNAVRTLVGRGARIIVVSLTNSHMNPRHEREVRAIVEQRYPRHYLRAVPLQLGSQVSDHVDDELRLNTAALNAYIHGEVASSLYKVESRLRELGLAHPLLVVRGSGECSRVAKTVAVETFNSGPAAAAFGAASLTNGMTHRPVVTFDMGGTSLDIAIIRSKRPRRNDSPHVGGVRVGIPLIEVESIGAGGGSIASIEQGQLKVGPDSAGAIPGPASFGKGGDRPTVTDANVAAGFIDPEFFLGGRMKLDATKAAEAIKRDIAEPMGLSVADAAFAIRDAAENEAAHEIAHRLSSELADGGEGAAVFACGGAGGLHACATAELVGIRSVTMFPFGSVFSAFGSSTTDVVHTYHQRVKDRGEISGVIGLLFERAARDMTAEGFRPEEFSARYLIRAYGPDNLGADVAEGSVDHEGDLDAQALVDDVQDGSSYLVEVRATAEVFHWRPDPGSAEEHAASPTAWREVNWVAGEKAISTPVFRIDVLHPGSLVQGPAIIEADDTNLVIPHLWGARVDNVGNVVAERH